VRIVVTGATGFLGGALTRRLNGLGIDVVALGRDRAKLAALEAHGVRTMVLDLATGAPLPDIEADAFVHCAALSSPWGSRAAFHRANVVGTRAALTIARAARIRRFVQISTPSVYFRFRDQIGVREDAALPSPVNAYAATKREAEDLVLAAEDLDPIVLRPRGIYGPGDTTLLPRLIAVARKRPLPLMNGGRAATDLTFIEDVVDAAYAAVVAKPQQTQRIFNISGGEALKVRDIAERAGERANCAIRWRRMPPEAVFAFARLNEAVCAMLPHRPEPLVTAYGAALFAFTQTLNIEAAAKHLGWTPRVRFDEGLARTFEAAPA
jgi:nucleoside-diphosphate-sugar epimerase